MIIKKIFSLFISALYSFACFSASEKNTPLEFSPQHAKKLTGIWDGELILEHVNVYRNWKIVRKGDLTFSIDFNSCDLKKENCNDYSTRGMWNADENFFYTFNGYDEDKNPVGKIYRYEIIDDRCVEFSILGNIKEFQEGKISVQAKGYDPFTECKQ